MWNGTIRIFGNCWCPKFQKLVTELHKSDIAYEPHPLENKKERELLKTKRGLKSLSVMEFPVVSFGKGTYAQNPTLSYMKEQCGK